MNKQFYSKLKGFNLQGMFTTPSTNHGVGCWDAPGYFEESDFRMIRELGFNFVRLPLSYRVWGDPTDLYAVDEKKLAPLDKAVEYGEKYGIHVNIAMHRAPGFCVNDDEPIQEKYDLWKDDEALKAFRFHFHKIAERYVGVSDERLSYNVINEPPHWASGIDYIRVCRGIIDEIRSVDPERVIFVDGLSWGRDPIFEMLRQYEKNIVYACRGYDPQSLTHYGVDWATDDINAAVPMWPGNNLYTVSNFDGRDFVFDRKELRQYTDLWGAVGDIYDVPVHCSEFGAYCKAPHDAVLSWMEDLLSGFSKHGIGWAMWNFRGRFGLLDSDRSDVNYEDFHGHKLDRKMLDLLLKY